MQTRVHLTTGAYLTSDHQPDESLKRELGVHGFENAVKDWVDAAKNIKELTGLSLEVSGQTVFINPANVTHVEIVMDGDVFINEHG